MRARLLAAIVLSLGCSSIATAYIRLNTYPPQSANDPPSVPMARPDFTAIQFYISSALVAGLQSPVSGITVMAGGSNPVGAARAALATWNASGANIKFLPLQSADATQSAYPPATSDGKNVILMAANSDDVSYVGGKSGAIAITNVVYTTGSGTDPYNVNLTVGNGSIVDSDIILNPYFQFNTDGTGSGSNAAVVNGNTTQDLQAVLTHELGHSLGANHTGLLGATMFQFAAIDQRFLSVDDQTFVKTVYPVSTLAASYGTVNGNVTTSSGAGVAYGMLTLTDTAQKFTLGSLTNADGTFSVQVPPGNYVIYAEPFNSIVQTGNLYLTSAQAALAAPFETTFYGGISNPTAVNVTAGSSATVNFSVTAGSATLNLPYFGVGAAGKNGDVATYFQVQGPLEVPSGQSIDLVFGGPGYDGTLTTNDISVFGGGITVSGIRIDTATTLQGGLKLQRLTLNISAASTSTPASIVITKGGATLSLSAVLVVTPPTPVFTSASLVSAASYLGTNAGGLVTPGGIYALFTPTGSPATLGPATPVLNGGYDAYSQLPSNLAGVSVTFDGVPAPLFFVYNGQINLQVPFEVAGKSSTNVVVSYFGAANSAVSVPVFPIQPAFFTFTPQGTDAVIVNDDGSVNSASRPVKQAHFVTIYGTGVGVTNLGASGYGTGLRTGSPAPVFPSGYTGNFTCSFSTNTVPAAFGGWSPGSVGLAQWNVQVPSGLTGALSLQCTDTASGTKTQTGTIYVN